MTMRKKLTLILMAITGVLARGALAQVEAGQAEPVKSQEPPSSQPEIIGTIFASPVPLSNYNFVRSTIAVFGNYWGKEPKNQQELDEAIWEQLVLSFEAFRRNITVTDEELQQQLAQLLEKEKVDFDYKADSQALAKWVSQKTNEPLELFLNQLRHLVQLQKLLNEVKNSFNPLVRNQEVEDRFYAENNHLDLEFAYFKEEKKAWEFFNQARKDKKFWDKAKKDSSQIFRRTSLVTIIFLAEAWKFPKDELYRIAKLPLGTIYKPLPIYNGYVVAKCLNMRLAKPEDFSRQRYVYYDKVLNQKKEEVLKEWIRKLKNDAKIQIFKKGG